MLMISLSLQSIVTSMAPEDFVKVICQTLSVSEGRLVGKLVGDMQWPSQNLGGEENCMLNPPAWSPWE